MTRADQKTVLTLLEDQVQRATNAAETWDKLPGCEKLQMQNATRATRLQQLAQRLRKEWGMEVI